MIRFFCYFLLMPGGWLMAQTTQTQPTQYATIGQIIRLDPQLDGLIPAGSRIELIGSGFAHLEGPVWVRDSAYLLVNDTKAQTTYKWSPKTGLDKFVQHTGYTGRLPYGKEPGTNGMAVDQQGRLISCEHGDRRLSAMPLRGQGGKRTLTDNVRGKRYSSPNDVVVHPDGSFYFTDPPFGLPLKEKDPTRETTVNGVYHLLPTGQVTLVAGDMTSPNGLAFSPDYKTLYISESDSLKQSIRAFPVRADGSLGQSRVFFDASVLPKIRMSEVTDGLKTDRAGNVWATGPGGVLIISAAGKLLGRIDTGEVIANCAWGDDGSVLYLASGTYLCRIRTATQGNLGGQ